MYRQLIRTAFIIGFGTFALAGTSTPTIASDLSANALEKAPMLREHVVVEENVIRLNDLFTNVTERAEAPVAYAPQAGKRAVLDARWLYRVARLITWSGDR